MKTEIITADLQAAADILTEGGLVAVPTETVYGLAGNGLNEAAVEEIYRVKGRPEVKALSLMVPGPEAMEQYCEDVPQAAKDLAKRFWPGPLTIILKSKPLVPEIVRAGGATVGLRCPDHELTLRLLRLCALPLAAPSANPSGAPSPKTAGEVLAYFDGQIGGVIDGGPCGLGRESTILDMSRAPYRILRQGALPEADIGAALTERLTVIGVTGGSGSGKTTALEALKARGALVLDCDAVYHELLESSEPLLRQIEASFPGVVKDGVLDRKALGARVFADEEKLLRLNAITHRQVGMEVERRLEAWAWAGGELAAVDAIGLFEGGLDKHCAAVIGVTAPEEERVRRIMARDGISRDYALLRIRAQKPDSYFEEHCSHLARNDGGRTQFADKINRIIQEVLGNG